MSSMRGGFRSAVGTGAGGAQGERDGSPLRRRILNVVTVLVLLAAAVILLRRFGVLDLF